MIPSVFPMQVGPANSQNSATAQGPTSLGFGPMQAFDPSQSTTRGASNSPFGQIPSTEGFLHVLDMLLSASPMPQAGSTSISNLLVQTSVTTSSAENAKAAQQEEDIGALSLDPSLCAGIAALLQGLGFQVQPKQISQLSPIDREQLDSALEFVSRNLQKGTAPTQVAEYAALLLPRPWPLDDLTGAPTTTATAMPGQETLTLPTGFVKSLDQVRSQLHAGIVASASSNARAQVAVSAPDRGNVSNNTNLDQMQAAPPSGTAKAATVPSVATTPSNSSLELGLPANQTSDPALQVLQGLQQSTATKDPTTGLVASDVQTRHLPPGGTASELIGRQIGRASCRERV